MRRSRPAPGVPRDHPGGPHPISHGGISSDTLDLALREGGMAAWEWDLATDAIRWSAAMGPQFGLDPGAVPPGIDAFLALVHPADREGVRGAAGVAAERGGTHELRFRARWPDGSDHWLAASVHVLPDPENGAPARCVGITRPVDGAEAAIAEAPEGERLFRQFAEVAPVLVWVADAGGACTFVSQGWLEFTQTRLEDNLGAGWLELMHPDDRGALRAAWERARDTREPFELEYRLRRGDGAWRWVLDRGRPIEDPDGVFSGWVGGCVDLHERAESEEEARLLSDAGRLLAGALEVEEHLDAVAALAVPALGDRCAIVAREDAAPAAAHLADAIPEELQGPLGTSEGTCVVAPLVARGRAFGVLAAAAEPGRVLDVRELRIAQELANRVALALDGARLLRLARASEQASGQASAILDAYVATAPVGLALYDADLRYQRVNEVLAEVHGVPAADHLGRRPDEVLRADGKRVLDLLREVRATGETRRDVTFTQIAPDGSPRQILATFFPVRLPDGAIAGIGSIAHDVTERVRAERDRAALLDRVRLLADASAVLDASLDHEATLQALVLLAVERVADGCAVEVLGDDGALEVVASEHRDPAKAGVARRLREHPSPEDAPVGRMAVLRTGVAELHPRIRDSDLERIAQDPAQLALLRELGLRSAVFVALKARGRTLGVLSLVRGEGEPFGEEDLALARDLGRRAALAIDNARLYASAREQERASEAARSVLDTLIDQAPVGFAYFDTELRYVQVNRALCAINGLTEEEHLGRRVPEILPDVGGELDAALARVLATGESLVDLEVTGTTPADPVHERHYLLSLYRIRLPGGAMLGVGATVLDITERREAEEALRAQRDLYETLLRAQSELGEGFVLAEGERILYVNEAAERIAGPSAQELYALASMLEVFPPERRADIGRRIERTQTEGLVDPGFQTEIATPSGTRVAIEVSARPLAVEGGPPRMVVLVRDIADRKRQELERERLLAAERAARRESELARDRAAFLADVSGALERSMELGVVLQEVAERMAGTLADVATISVLSRDGQRLERAGAAARDEPRRTDLMALRGRVIEASPVVATAQVSLSGQARFYPSLSEDDVRSFATAPDVLEALRRVLGRSVALVPLTAGGRSFGVLALSWDEEGHVPADEDRRLLDEIARRLALAIDNAQLYAERAHIASTLQASLLPPDLPLIPGVETAARYQPAGEASEVGGDFYDLYGLDEGSWAIMVGDVCGKGAEAAAVTAMARYTLRAASAAAAERPDPAGAFALLNRQMCAERVPERFLSAVLGRLMPRDGGRMDLLLACAGHPAPIVLRAGGEAAPVRAGGPLLGVDDAAAWTETRVSLGPGDAIVFYTDGVTEALRTEPLSADDLAALLPAGAGASAEALADAVRDLAHTRAPGPLRDDVAIVALRLTGTE
jgi:PAS domain S-box-containing protein